MNKDFIVKEYKVHSDKLKSNEESALFVVMSDLHNVSMGNQNDVVINKIREINPDAVLIVGDMLIGKPGYSMEVALHTVCQIAKYVPVYYANGNHEYRMKIYPENYGDSYQKYRNKILDAGVILLENQAQAIRIRGNEFCIYGLEIPAQYYSKKKKIIMEPELMEQLLGKFDPAVYNIVLAHNPKYTEAYAKSGPDLVLSGHYHGGMVRVGNIGLISPYIRLFPKYAYGRYRIDKTDAIITAGLGEHTIPIRIHNRREMVTIEITNKI